MARWALLLRQGYSLSRRRLATEAVAPSLPAPGFEAGPGVGEFDRLLAKDGPAKAVAWALQNRKSYKENKVAWQPLLERITGPDENQKDFGYLRRMKMQDLLEFVQVLVTADVTQSSFWDTVTQATWPIYSCTGSSEEAFKENLELAKLYAQIGAWHPEVFQAVYQNKESSEDSSGAVNRLDHIISVHTKTLVHVLAIFGRAGSASASISSMATRVFATARERLEVEDPKSDWHDLTTEHMLSIIDSMARFKTKDNETLLRKFGRERLHPNLLQLEPKDIAKLCSAYSILSWQHHTVLKEVVLAIMSEQQKLQQDKAIGMALPGADTQLRFGSSEIALILDAMLVLRLYRGNNPWFNWGQRFAELMALFLRRLETSEDLKGMPVRPLTAAAYALGRGKLGNEAVCQAMMDRMMTILQREESLEQKEESFPDAPQDYLERFMFGIAMMGPSKRKEFLNTEWLRDWMCNNYYKLSLQNIVRINRYLVQIRSFDKNYLEVFVEFFCENMDQLEKCDIQDLTHTYNHARLGEEDLGRHFFWALGKQFQRQHVKRVAAEMRRMGRSRNFERYG